MMNGIPHVLLPDATGKIRDYRETWALDPSSLVTWVESVDEAEQAADDLLRSSAP